MVGAFSKAEAPIFLSELSRSSPHLIERHVHLADGMSVRTFSNSSHYPARNVI